MKAAPIAGDAFFSVNRMNISRPGIVDILKCFTMDYPYTTITKPMAVRPIIQGYDVVYSVVPGITPAVCRQLHMSIIVPRTDEPLPLIVVYPGGGFKTADWHLYLPMRMALANAGYVVACAEYRTIPDTYPALVVDAKAALRYLRANCDEYNINPDKVGVIGLSAGGYVSNMVGATIGESMYEEGENLGVSTSVDAVATLYGISDLRNIGDGLGEAVESIHRSNSSSESLLMNGVAFPGNPPKGILELGTAAVDASPMGHLATRKPPFLLMAGDKDEIVSPVQSHQWYDALRMAGNEAKLIMLKDAGHENDPCWAQDAINDILISWFDRQLK